MGRSTATAIIWIVVGILLGVGLSSSTSALQGADGAVIFGVVLAVLLAAVLSTLAIWMGGPNQREQETGTHYAKAKRLTGRLRAERLLDQLDDDEVYDLESLLLARREESSHNQQR